MFQLPDLHVSTVNVHDIFIALLIAAVSNLGTKIMEMFEMTFEIIFLILN